MRTVNIHEAKTHLSRLVDAAAGGEDIVIAKAGKPVAKLGPIEAVRAPRGFGFLKGKISVPDDFDEPLPEEIVRLFEEGEG
jgi:prevent-host-death family protein